MNLLRMSTAAVILVVSGALAGFAEPGQVTVSDGGLQKNPATWECTPGHQIEKHSITLDSGARRYRFNSSGCCDPSHGEKRPCNEGNFGMPEPIAGNWYWGGFFQVFVNGTDTTAYRVSDMRVVETGARGAFQIVWQAPEAEVGLRLMMLPGANHVMTQLVWHPKAGTAIKTVTVRLCCYPSFFTTSQHRKGERHCQTPHTDMMEPKVLQLEPARDTYLYYYDTVFDMAKGEGNGPCAALVEPSGVQGGKVEIGDYAETTFLDLKPDAGQARFSFYDFAGSSNAAAETYLKTHGAADLATLTATDFRPTTVRHADLTAFAAEAQKLLADAADDGAALKPKVDGLLARVAALKGKADSGDWGAEADLATEILGSADLLWKLRAFAALNGAK